MREISVTIRFHRRGGCPRGVAEDMARYDGARITGTSEDDDCEPNHLRSVTMAGPNEPTMARWASFMVGAFVSSRSKGRVPPARKGAP